MPLVNLELTTAIFSREQSVWSLGPKLLGCVAEAHDGQECRVLQGDLVETKNKDCAGVNSSRGRNIGGFERWPNGPSGWIYNLRWCMGSKVGRGWVGWSDWVGGGRGSQDIGPSGWNTASHLTSISLVSNHPNPIILHTLLHVHPAPEHEMGFILV